MTLDELVQSIPDSEAELRSQLHDRVTDWKNNDQTLDDLVYMVGEWRRNVGFKELSVSDEFYRNWLAFKANAIEGMGGMTVNERLYWFGLFVAWDAANEKEQLRLRDKLKARA